MLERAILVRAMSLALLASACAGVALVFLPNVPGTGKVAGTAGIVVAACALLLVRGLRGSGDRLTAAQRTWVVFITVPAAAAIALVWLGAPSGSILERVSLGLFTWLGYGLPSFLVALPALRTHADEDGVRMNGTSRRILAACAFTAFVVAMLGHQAIGLVLGDVSFLSSWIYLTIVLHGGLAAAAASALPSAGPGGERSRAERMTGIFGLTVSAASLVAWLVLLVRMHWNALTGTGGVTVPPDDSLLAVAVGLASAAATVALWSPLRAMRLTGAAQVVHVLATALTGALGMMASAAAQGWMVQVFGDELFGRVVFALVILDVCALIAVAIAVRTWRHGRGSAAFALPVESVRVRCPRCQARMELRPGENACTSCGLVTVIGFRDDRCPACEYDLRTVAPCAACPECGRARQVP